MTLRKRRSDGQLMPGARSIANPLHSAATPEWFTPARFVEAARQVLGAIDLDPASCAQANETVRAMRIWTAEDDGLVQPWSGRVLLNPPGGRGLVSAFWSRLVAAWRAGDVPEAIWIGYSLEQLQTLQAHPDSPLDFPLCFTRRRISFEAPGGGKRSPTHSNYIAHLPALASDEASAKFVEVFSQFGRVRL